MTEMKSRRQLVKIASDFCNDDYCSWTPRTSDIQWRNTLQNSSTPDEQQTPDKRLSASTTYKFFARWYASWVSTKDKQCLMNDQFLRRDLKIIDNIMDLTLMFYFVQNMLFSIILQYACARRVNEECKQVRIQYRYTFKKLQKQTKVP